MTARKPFVFRFWDRVDIQPEGCWNWTGSTTSNGYGWLSTPVRHDPLNRPNPRPQDYAHRVAWCLSHDNTWPAPGQVVRHTCDNPLCCNPEHLLIGTQADNCADRTERSAWVPKRALTDEQVRSIRRSHLSQIKLAKMHGVSQTCISNVQRRKTYNRVPEFIISPSLDADTEAAA